MVGCVTAQVLLAPPHCPATSAPRPLDPGLLWSLPRGTATSYNPSLQADALSSAYSPPVAPYCLRGGPSPTGIPGPPARSPFTPPHLPRLIALLPQARTSLLNPSLGPVPFLNTRPEPQEARPTCRSLLPPAGCTGPHRQMANILGSMPSLSHALNVALGTAATDNVKEWGRVRVLIVDIEI